MSPASAGALEVEKYIGSYLISSTARSKNGSKNGGTSGCKHSNNNFNRDNHSIGGGAHHSSHRHNNVFNGNILLAEFPPQGYGSPLGNGGGTPDVWAGGLPLISMANHQRRNCGAKKNHNPLVRVGEYRHQPSQFARLAIHTHGAPLILTGRHNGNRGNKTAPGANYQKQHQQLSVQQQQHQVRNFATNENDSKSVLGDNGSKDSASDQSKDSATVSNIDCMSVASDESSGSNNSENCLPRIIKPRKRRKKDRKPNTVNNNNTPNNSVELTEVAGDLKRTDNGNNSTSSQCNVNNSSDNNSNIVTLKPYMPFSYEKYDNRQNNTQRNRYNTNYFNNKVNCDQINAPVNDFNRFRISDSSNNNNVEIPDVPKLTHNFEDIKVCDEASSANTSSYQVQQQCESVTCQCKYCDPSGLNIWNADKNGGFSPFAQHFESFFTSPNSALNATSTSDIFTSIGERDDEFSLNENAADKASSAALRRSWSDPVSSFSPSVASDYSSSSSTAGSDISSCKVGVIGAGRQGREWHGVPPDCNVSRCSSSISSSISSGNFEMFPLLNTSSQVLDISTEIVTSLNGHRDLEIKFFSSSAASSPIEEKSFSTTGFEARVLFSVNSLSGCGDIANGNLVKSGRSMGGDGDQLWDNAEKDCDITYDTTDISRLLLEAEE